METTILEIVSPAFELDKISAQAAALARRDELLTKARKGTAITSPEQATRAAAFLKDLATFTRTIEETRAAVKAPILEAGKKIDAVARTLTVDLEAEAKRIGGLLASFQAEQKRKEEEARRLAWQEQERIRLDAEKKVREAREKAEAEERERQRKAREEQDKLRAAVDRARSEEGRAKREQELKEAQERAERERIEREDRERQEAEKRRQETAAASAKAASAVVPVAKKIEGVAVGSEIKFEVTDIEALREAHPMFVLLSPNNAAIKAALKTMAEGKSLPGVRHWRKAKTVVR